MSTLQLRAPDGSGLSAYVARPEQPPRGAVVVLQEVFGVNSHIRRVAEQYAAQGYLAIAPALFDRLQRGVELPYAAVAEGIELVGRLTDEQVLADVGAAIDAVRHAGRVGVVGYCWGGRVAYLAACRKDVAAAVAYYGGGIARLLRETPRCPIMFHFGERDEHIPLDDVERIRAAVPRGLCHLYPAGHGFNCTDRATFDPESARLAFERSCGFFGQHLG